MGSQLTKVVHHFHRLGVAGRFLADLRVRRVGQGTAHKAGAGRDHPRQAAEVVLPSPKTTAGQVEGSPSVVVGCQGIELLPADELDRQAVDAVAGILFGQSFALKNVAEVATAVVAEDFDAAAVGITNFFNRAGHFVVETGPTAAGAELVLAIVKRGIATAANEDTVDLEVVILAGEGHFGAFVDNDAGFLGGKGVVIF